MLLAPLKKDWGGKKKKQSVISCSQIDAQLEGRMGVYEEAGVRVHTVSSQMYGRVSECVAKSLMGAGGGGDGEWGVDGAAQG